MGRVRSKQTKRLHKVADQKTTFIEHLQELRKRLFFVAASVIAGGAIAYNFHEPITRALLAPANGQQFIYTSPGGGFDFLFRICLYGGILFAIPTMVYQLLRYLEPLMKHESLAFIRKGAFASVVLAAIGIISGYSIGLPAALHFLLQGFSSEQIKALITIQSYMSFVMMYLLASALLFQIPLILLLINRIKPLKPKQLLKHERWMIVGALVISAIISPTPDIQNLLLLSIPMIAMYQLGIFLVWIANRKHRRPKRVTALLAQDAEIRAQRLAQFQSAQATLQQTPTITPQSAPIKVPAASQTTRPRKYVDMLAGRRFERAAMRTYSTDSPQAT